MSTTARTLSQMSLSQKLGQMFVVCLHGFSLEPETVRMLEEFHFGSVYLYNLNYINPRYMGRNLWWRGPKRRKPARSPSIK